MKRIFTILTAILLTTTMWAQSVPQKISYQAVIRDVNSKLITSHAIGMRISILQTSSSGTSVYTETQSTTTNINGLVTIDVGTGTVVSGSFASINWANGPYFIKTETDPTGGTNYTAIVGTSQLVSVPYALYAGSAANGFSANYNDLTNKPTIPAAQVNSDWNSNSGLSQILNKPTLFSGAYSDLTGKPILWDSTWASIKNKPTLFSGAYSDLTGKPILWDSTWASIKNKPTLATDTTNGFMSASDKAKLNSTDTVVMIHTSLGNAPATYATIGNLKFRYNSTSSNGYIEVETVNSSEHMMVFCDKKYSSWNPGGSSTIENYHNDASYSNSSWTPLISLWDGTGWNDHITMAVYDLFEGTLYNMGNDGNPPANHTFYEFYITIDGYNNVFIKVEHFYN